jgi:hypothetical protein
MCAHFSPLLTISFFPNGDMGMNGHKKIILMMRGLLCICELEISGNRNWPLKKYIPFIGLLTVKGVCRLIANCRVMLLR